MSSVAKGSKVGRGRSPFGPTVRFADGRVSFRGSPRAVAVGGVLTALTIVLSILLVSSGDFPVPLGDVVKALVGAGDESTTFIVRDLRLPRAVCAILVGAALGISGAVFQALTGNPLGSPDIIGFGQGATVGALIAITVLDLSGVGTSAGALAGGLLTAAVVYGLAYRRGTTTGYRLILVGIAITFLMISIADFMLARARIDEAQEATRWLLGSLNGRTWSDVGPLALGLLIVVPLLVPAARSLRSLELGDEAARGLGVNVERSRVVLVALGVVLVSMTVVAVGPVGFVALTAPQIARRLARAASPPLVCSALTGAVLMLASDLAAQRLVPGTSLPVGIMTAAIGGTYLAWLLTMQWRSAST